jgi:SAM-dependent methyltransferase
MKKNQLSKKNKGTIEYYNQNADEYAERTVDLKYAERTVDLNLEHLYKPFFDGLPLNGFILDAGCGPGRDSKKFIEMGYEVIGFDASVEMVKLAKKNSSAEVLNLKFSELTFNEKFDGVWACASLLHLPYKDLLIALDKLSKALKPNGILYCSFKYGEGECQIENRLFTYMNEEKFSRIIKESSLKVNNIWISEDLRPDRKTEKWLNAVCIK